MTEFVSKNAMVIGGTHGIGLATANMLNARGADVSIVGRDFSEVKPHFGKFTCDLSNLELLNEQFSIIRSTLANKLLDILVFSAGIHNRDKYIGIDDALKIINVNLLSAKICIDMLRSSFNKSASIVFISSVCDRMGWKPRGIYSSSKAALTQLTRDYASELISSNIRVNSVSPGFTDTAIFHSLDEEKYKKFQNAVPMKRIAKPEEIAEAICFLASDRASYITGSNLVVDGGLTSIFDVHGDLG